MRLQVTLRSVAERDSELGVLLVHYSKPGSAQRPTGAAILKMGMDRVEEGNTDEGTC